MNEEEIRARIRAGRDFLRMPEHEEDYQTDQQLKKPQPPLVKEAVSDIRIPLPVDYQSLPIDNDFLHIINSRSSHRVYTDEEISLLELSYLLWCSQGVKGIRGRAYATLRTVPCGGARHEFEAYLYIRKVEGLQPGCYHYLPLSHELEFLKEMPEDFVSPSLEGQAWARKASVIFYYSFVAYRAEWRYGIHAHRMVPADAGHVTENLYLAATSIGLGGCAIGAVDGKLCDEAFGLDGEEEFIFYAFPLGTVRESDQQKELDFYAFVREQGL